MIHVPSPCALRRAIYLPGALLLLALAPSLSAQGATEPPLWQRLHAAFYGRPAAAQWLGEHEALDPLLWPNSAYLLEEERARHIAELLRDTLAHPARVRGLPSLERALIQRDLWPIHDWMRARSEGAARARAIAKVMRLVALPAAEIDALPDSYAAAVARAAYPPAPPDPHTGSAYLPRDLFASEGPWLRIARNEEQPAAPTHVEFFGGRSVFSVHLRVPGGREAARAFVAELADVEHPFVETEDGRELRADLPQLPLGTQVALVRRLVLIDDEGVPHATRLVESVQLRRYLSLPSAKERTDGTGVQQFNEFELHRASLLAGRGGLHAVAKGAPSFPRFGSHGYDPFLDEPVHPTPALSSCIQCHGQPGTYSLASLTGIFAPSGFPQRRTRLDRLTVKQVSTATTEAEARAWLNEDEGFAALTRGWAGD